LRDTLDAGRLQRRGSHLVLERIGGDHMGPSPTLGKELGYQQAEQFGNLEGPLLETDRIQAGSNAGNQILFSSISSRGMEATKTCTGSGSGREVKSA